MNKKILFRLSTLLLISIMFFPIIFSQTNITGQKIVTSGNNFEITTTPHTSSQVTPPFTQEIKVFNKTNDNNVFLTLEFDTPLESFEFEKLEPKKSEIVLKVFNCPADYTLDLNFNVFPGQDNSHQATCYKPKTCTIEAIQGEDCAIKGKTYSEYLFNGAYENFGLKAGQIVYYDSETTKEKWINRTQDLFGNFLEKKVIYNFQDQITPETFETYRLTYTPREWKSEQGKFTIRVNALGDGSKKEVQDPWFDNDFLCKFRVDLNTSLISSDVNNLPIPFNFNPSSHEIAGCTFNADGSDFRIVSSDEATSLPYYFEGDWTNTDVNAHFLLNDFNGMLDDDDFFVYFGNTGAVSQSDSNSVFTTTDFNASYDFDQNMGLYQDRTSNDLDPGPTAEYYINIDRNGSALIGTNAPLISNNGSESYINLPQQILEGSPQFSVTAWQKSSVADLSIDEYVMEQQGPGDDPIRFFRSFNGENFLCIIDFGASSTTIQGNTGFTDTDWHNVVCTFDGSQLRLFVDGVEDATPEAVTGLVANTSASHVIATDSSTFLNSQLLDEISFWKRSLLPDEVKVLYKSQAQDGFILGTGATEQNNAAPVINVVYPENSESFNKDTNSFIDLNFTVQDSDNNVSSFLVDINYSTSQVEGTGTIIVDDANLQTDFSCADTDLTSAVECKYNWDISGVTNNDYYLLVKASDGTSSDFNSGEATFTITSTATSSCTNNGINNNWVINEECNFKDTIIDIGTGTLNITKNGLIGLDNATIKTQKINYEPGSTGVKIRRTNGGNTILNK